MIKLQFINQDAIPKEQEILLAARESIDPVVDWYSAFFAGDDYRVFVNGKEMALDMNGQRASVTIDVSPNLKLVTQN